MRPCKAPEAGVKCQPFSGKMTTRLTCRSRGPPANGVQMRTFLQIVFALSVAWSIAACTQTLNDANVWIDDSRKKTIGR